MKKQISYAVLAIIAFFSANTENVYAETDLQNIVSKYDAKVYGFVELDVFFDNADIDGNGDSVSTAGASEDYDVSSTSFNPRGSRIGIDISDKNNGDWLSEAKLEMDFKGLAKKNTFTPRLRHGFLKLTNKPTKTSITVGQTWAPIAKLHVPTIDAGVMSQGGNIWARMPQITVKKNFDNNFNALISLAEYRKGENQDKNNAPWILSRLAYENENLLAAIGGGWRNGDLKGENDYENINRWVAALELKYKMGLFTFMIEPWIGEGVDDFSRGPLGINNSTKTPEAMLAWGGFSSLQIKATDSNVIALGYGIDDPKDKDIEGMKLTDKLFYKNQRAFINTWQDLTDSIKIGAELDYVRTDREKTHDGFRILLATKMTF